MTDWNTHFRRICMSHRLVKADIVECCRLGGIEISLSKAEAWRRSAASRHRHVTAMTEAEFDAFTYGLVEWAREAYRDDADR